MKIVGYQIFLRITRFVILVIRPDYQEFCLRSTPANIDCDQCFDGNKFQYFVMLWLYQVLAIFVTLCSVCYYHRVANIAGRISGQGPYDNIKSGIRSAIWKLYWPSKFTKLPFLCLHFTSVMVASSCHICSCARLGGIPDKGTMSHHVFMCHTKRCISQVGSMSGTHCSLLKAVDIMEWAEHA